MPAEDVTRQPKILVVDDEPNNFDVIEVLLSKENYDLQYASSGLNVIQRLNRVNYDLMLLDIMMPDLDGINLCKQIKAQKEYTHIPIIMVTALDSKDDLANALLAGADDFISKPLSGQELRARVKSMLRIKFAHDRIQSLLSLREEMTHAIVHDLRNPITAILLANSGLELMQLPEPATKKVQRINSATHRLKNLVDNILILSKVEAGKLTLNQQTVDLCALSRQAINDFQVITVSKAITVMVDFSHPIINLKCDADLVRRTIDNLISNAIKFSPPNSIITISIKLLADRVEISVADQGKGVSSHLKQAIFQKYESYDVSSSVVAIGLGLSFCKTVIEAHGGEISVQDNQPRGAIFKITLPFSS
jgi:two-component system sensor histidine kinase/response regulator